MNRALMTVAVLGAAMALSACKSSTEPGVKSDLRSQWTMVNADVRTTTSAAESVLKGEGLIGVTSTATMVDGKAHGKKADGTDVDVTIEKEYDQVSKLSVQIGTMGEPELGASIARKTKLKAEGK